MTAGQQIRGRAKHYAETVGRLLRGTTVWKIASLVLLSSLLPLPLRCELAADKDQVLEFQVKAAFLLNFTKFIEWPPPDAAPDAPFAICILGDDPFGRTLDRIVEGETVNGRKLIVQRIRRQQANSCQMIFAGRMEKDLAKFFAALGPGILTVGEEESFVHEGGMIGFVIENRHVRFDINQTAAANAGLKCSSKLLTVARFVEK